MESNSNTDWWYCEALRLRRELQKGLGNKDSLWAAYEQAMSNYTNSLPRKRDSQNGAQ